MLLVATNAYFSAVNDRWRPLHNLPRGYHNCAR